MSNISKIFLLTLMMSCDEEKITVTEQKVVDSSKKNEVSRKEVKTQILLKSINREKVFTRAINEVNNQDLIIEEYETKM
jgi:hypothetical protein